MKILLFALATISFLLAKDNISCNQITETQIKNENINTSNKEKIVIVGANGELGRQIANQLWSEKEERELHFTFSSQKSLSEFKEYAKKHFPNYNDNAIKGHVVNLLDENSISKNILCNSIVIISASAKPSYKGSQIIFWTKVWLKKSLGMNVNEMLNDAPLEYTIEQTPEKIDWLGQKKIIDSAKKAKHILLISSMLGSYENNFLNRWGGVKNISLWKRKAEKYLKDSNICYTIIHSPHLIDKKASLHFEDFFLGVNDLRDKFPPQKDLSVPPPHVIFNLQIARSDLAYFIKECIEQLYLVKNKSFDIVRRKDINITALKIDNLHALVTELGDEEYDYSYPKHPILEKE